MSEIICIHVFVSGKVQGVWFRASTKTEADKLGVKGFARNLPDGRVEVIACGEKDKIAILIDWLKKGPSLAEVTEFSYEEIECQAFEGFETL